MEQKEQEETYDWTALDDYRRSIDNIQALAESLDGVAEELSSLQDTNRLPSNIPVSDPIIKIRAALANLESAYEDLNEEAGSFEETLINQESI